MGKPFLTRKGFPPLGAAGAAERSLQAQPKKRPQQPYEYGRGVRGGWAKQLYVICHIAICRTVRRVSRGMRRACVIYVVIVHINENSIP